MFDEIIREVVSIANDITADGNLQCQVIVERKTGQTSTGKPIYDPLISPPTNESALVEYGEKFIQTATGQQLKVVYAVTFLYQIEIGSDDQITLPNGKTGRVITEALGFEDPAVFNPFVTTVYLQ